MDVTTHLAAVRRDGELLAALDGPALDQLVPACPAWTIAELLGHTGWVHRWVTATLLAPPDQPPHPKTIERAPTEAAAVPAWFRTSLDGVLAALEQCDVDITYKTFAGPQPGRWWARRMAHETAMHRWDAQDALGDAEPIDAELAVDAVDEALDTFVSRRFDHAAFGSTGQTVHLHATDIEGEWMLTMQPDAVVWERAHGKGDVAVRGPASELLLLLMSRRGVDGLETYGDAALLRRWQDAANF